MTSTSQQISNVLRKMGIPTHILGYIYLREAINMIVCDKTIIKSITTKLYPDIAISNNTTPSRVERAIRYAISKTETVESFEKVTNGSFIARIAEDIREGWVADD